MLITFARALSGSTLATIRRGDGVVLELPGYDRKYRVPHDLAHAVTERELGLAGGVFGSIAGGAVFDNMRVVAGKPRHDAAERSKRLLAANKRSLGVAEILAGVVHDAVEHDETSTMERLRRSWGVVSTEPLPWSEPEVAAAVAMLGDLAVQFEATGKVTFTWPDRRTSPMPAMAGTRRGRRGRL
jgi:hypothetical protein